MVPRIVIAQFPGLIDAFVLIPGVHLAGDPKDFGHQCVAADAEQKENDEEVGNRAVDHHGCLPGPVGYRAETQDLIDPLANPPDVIARRLTGQSLRPVEDS
jgi:hypothetical protein